MDLTPLVTIVKSFIAASLCADAVVIAVEKSRQNAAAPVKIFVISLINAILYHFILQI